MTKHNAKDFLPLVQALADGKTIQQCDRSTYTWHDLEIVAFGDSPANYRIKPEPREFAGKITETGRDYQSKTRSFTITILGDDGDLPECGKLMHLLEILD